MIQSIQTMNALLIEMVKSCYYTVLIKAFIHKSKRKVLNFFSRDNLNKIWVIMEDLQEEIYQTGI
jgi:hypothetical protein